MLQTFFDQIFDLMFAVDAIPRFRFILRNL